MTVSEESARTPWLTPDPIDLLRVLVLLGPLALILIGAKAHKLIARAPELQVGSTLAALSEDLLLVSALALLGLLGLSSARRGVALATAITLHVVAPILTLLAIFEHGFFMITGAIGDGFILADMLGRFSELTGVMGSAITPGLRLLLASPLLVSIVLAILLQRARKKAKLSAAPSPASWRRPVYGVPLVLTGLAFVIGLLFLPAPVPAALRSLEHTFYVSITSDLLLLSRGFADEGLSGLLPADEELSLIAEGDAAGKPRAKNLVFITLESVGAKNTTLHNPALQNMPYLVSLASRGAKVERAYTVTPHTSKALVSIHCGRLPKLVPGVDEANAGGIPAKCLARLLAEQGFATAYFQTAEEHYERRSDLVKEFGFEHYVGKESLNGEGFDEVSYFGWEDDVMIAPVVNWAAQQKTRFFLGLLTLTSHHPYGIPRGFPTQRFVADRDHNDYLNTLAYTDRFLKKLFAAFEAKGLLDDTLFVVMGDHGEAFGEHGRYQHDSVIYEETARVPMVLVGPGITPGSTITGLRQHIDLLPTALEALGFTPSLPVAGTSLLSSEGHDQVFLNCFYLRYCMGYVRAPAQKLIYNFDRVGPELYDLATDPEERRNLAEAPEHVRDVSAAISELQRTRLENDALYAARARQRRDKYVKRTRPVPSHPAEVDFGGLKIIGYDLEEPVFEAGDKTVITTYYEVIEKPDADLRMFMHVRGPRSMVEDHVPVEGAYPVEDWKPGDFVIDRHTITTRPDWQVGTYQIWTGFFHPGGRLPIVQTKLAAQDQAARLGTFKMTEPHVDTRSFVLSQRPAVKEAIDVGWGPGLRIIGTDIDKAEIKGGLKTTVTIVFEALAEVVGHPTFTLHLNGPSPKQRAHVPIRGTYPVASFKPGEFIVDRIEIITHTRDRPGTYRVQLELRDEQRVVVEPTGDPQRIENARVEINRYQLLRSE